MSRALGLLLLLPGLVAADATTNPRVQSGDITYLGYFNLPTPSSGTFNYGGMGLSVSADGASLYVGGHVYDQSLGRVAIPGTLGGTATLIQNPTSVPGSVGSGTTELSGTLIHNGRLIVQKRIPYDTDGGGTTHAVCNLSIASCSSFSRLANVPYAQYGNGYMTPIPAEWQTLLGGPALAGNSVMSINSLCSNGPSAYVFDPDDVGVTSPIPSTYVMGYPLATPLSNPNVANDLFSRADQYNGNLVFPSGTRSVLFIARHGYGTPTYKVDDGCGGSAGEGAAPYRRQVTAFDANDLLAVKNGTKQVHEVQPYAWWTFPGPADSCGKFAYSGVAYHDGTRRIYAALDYGETPRIHVYEVADLSPGDTTPPTVTSRTILSGGATVVFGFDEAVSYAGAAPTLASTGGPVTLSGCGAVASTITCNTSRQVLGAETVQASYTQPGNGIEDMAGNDLASFSGQAVTNQSTQQIVVLSALLPQSESEYRKEQTSVNLGVTTNKLASCRYGALPGSAWASLTAYNTVNNLTHTASRPVQAGGVYQTCSRCLDTAAQQYSGDICTRYSVLPDRTSPTW